jgi:hypothetical protein
MYTNLQGPEVSVILSTVLLTTVFISYNQAGFIRLLEQHKNKSWDLQITAL